jgi:hypothetical protein
MSRIGLRCSDNRTKRNSSGYGSDRDFTPDLASFGVSPAPLVLEQTCARELGFASANYKCLIPYMYEQTSRAAARPSQANENGPLFPLAAPTRVTGAHLFLYERGHACFYMREVMRAVRGKGIAFADRPVVPHAPPDKTIVVNIATW